MITARYRTDYPGEFVVTEARWHGGKREQTREWIPNPIENRHISGRAACIGSPVDHYLFDYTRLARHRGGLLGSLRLQTYGVSEVAHQMNLDFAVEINKTRLADLKLTGYHEENVVYTTSRLCVENPGEFYLIPYNPVINSIAVLPYLAAFDGHQEVFLLGYNQEATPGNTNWKQQVEQVIRAYTATEFVLVGVESNQPQAWFEYANVRPMSYPEFITYCDIR
jgi:hypothetical protein